MATKNIFLILKPRLSNKRRWLVPALISIIGLLYLTVMLSPMFQTSDTLLIQVRDTQGYLLFQERVLENFPRYNSEVRWYNSEEGGVGLIPLNPLVNVKVRAYSPYDVFASPSLRYDNLALFAGTLLIICLILFTLSSEKIERTFASKEVEADVDASTLNNMANTTTAEGVLQIGMIGAQHRAEAMFSRSTLLLAGGIIMAFIGVIIFYISLPSYSPSESPTSYLPKAIRPIGVLIFIESIAWFLLRQYRALIEDYKVFHRIYLKRTNFLAAYKLISGEKVRPEELFMAASLIDEDLTGKLKQGETAEALENVKIEEPSPVFALVDLIIKRGLDK